MASVPNLVIDVTPVSDRRRHDACSNFFRGVPTEMIESGDIGVILQHMLKDVPLRKNQRTATYELSGVKR